MVKIVCAAFCFLAVVGVVHGDEKNVGQQYEYMRLLPKNNADPQRLVGCHSVVCVSNQAPPIEISQIQDNDIVFVSDNKNELTPQDVVAFVLYTVVRDYDREKQTD
ncbi:exported hypothetical protein [Vibrio nigripulchritudo SFn27]|uniref:Periplasmic protein n=1 Tax=Vibrio nigripulchritudo TaxID=28173 RepID=A0A9P1JLG0_9VIBR|nr:hypothetical protein [Vibrio nigripulchritudo]CBJ93240.1 Protein of unknown function (exported) [Vibrio nigripulchritudo]CCN86064.1 exported hypothetical protein [Vibrio nigripulchritudo BLFn1]CCN92052.1 exported hypothetical protein [Vibrio nigripulchritudo SFn27]CCN97863.1 exported hypothetical protein [Vibrio nigripulchritudo ENn2]CCO44086.1 exported hypothetical protein [Vibrio nigripulchritudo SFn135]